MCKICQIFKKKWWAKGTLWKLLTCNSVPKADQIFTVLIKKFMVDHKTEELCKLGKQILQLVNQATKEKDQKSIKTALDFWKESTVKLENFDCQLPEACSCSFIRFYLDPILILYKFYSHFMQIFSKKFIQILYRFFIKLTLSNFYLDNILIKSG